MREKEQKKSKQVIAEALNLGLGNLETFHNTYNMYIIETGSKRRRDTERHRQRERQTKKDRERE